MPSLRGIALLVAPVITPLVCVAQTALPVNDLNPFLAGKQALSLPARTDKAQLSLSYSVANLSVQQAAGNQALTLDAQVAEQRLTWQQPLSDHWQWQVSMPVIRLSGGQSDHFIEQWHSTFNLPNGNRDGWPQNRLLLDYRADNVALSLTNNTQHLGDTQLSIGKTIDTPNSDNSGTHTSALWLTVTLPTGNADTLTGGHLNLGLVLSMEQTAQNWSSYQQWSVIHLTAGALPAQQRRWLASGTVGVGYRINSSWSWLTQFDAHTSAYHSDLRSLGQALQLSFGPRYQGQHWHTELSLSEDLAVDTAPDVQAQWHISRGW